tara:strand:- start:3870 stop:4904 length:1035 start_codon:yes stop_codon:yes gene_type:complete
MSSNNTSFADSINNEVDDDILGIVSDDSDDEATDIDAGFAFNDSDTSTEIDYGNESTPEPIVEPLYSPASSSETIDEIIDILASASTEEPAPPEEPAQPEEPAPPEESKQPDESKMEEKVEEVIQEEKVEEVIEEKECSVCYIKLNVNNIVNTVCRHNYCTKCFFRWMKSHSNCPMCRRNFISITTWYENQDVNAEISELTLLSEQMQTNMINMRNKTERLVRKKARLKAQNKILKKSNEEQLVRQISLRSDIEYARGYIEGLEGNPNQQLKKKLCNKSYRRCRFIHGYHSGFYERNQTIRKKNYLADEFEYSNVCEKAPTNEKVEDDSSSSNNSEPDEINACL